MKHPQLSTEEERAQEDGETNGVDEDDDQHNHNGSSEHERKLSFARNYSTDSKRSNNSVNNIKLNKFIGSHSIGLCSCRSGDWNTLAEILNLVSQDLADEDNQTNDYNDDAVDGEGESNETKSSTKDLRRQEAIEQPADIKIEFERIKEKAVINVLSQLRRYDLIEIQLGSYRNGLHYCVESQSIDCAKLLIEQFSPVILFTVDCDGLSPFHLAVISGNVDMTQLFIDRARLICWPDLANQSESQDGHDQEEGENETVMEPSSEIAQLSVQKLIELPDIELHSSIHWAVVCGEVDCLRVLLKEGGGAGLIGRDIHGASPLHYASAVTRFHTFNSKLASRRTSYRESIMIRRKSSLLRSLETNGHSLEESNIIEEEWALIGTRQEKRHKSCQILKLLIEAAKSVDSDETPLSSIINARDAEGRTPLIWAASCDHDDAIKLLHDLGGAQLTTADNEGLTAFHCAASRGYVQSLEALLEHCASNEPKDEEADHPKKESIEDVIDILDGLGCSPLFYAITCGQPDAVRVLLTAGANPSIQDRRGRTAAFCGASKGQLESLKVLASFALQYQVEAEQQDEPQPVPEEELKTKYVERLRNQIAWSGLWTRNNRGDLPIHEAVKSGRRDLVTWFLQQYVQLLVTFYGHMLNSSQPPQPITANSTEAQNAMLSSLDLLDVANRDFERFAQSLLLNMMTGRSLLHVAITSNPSDLEMIKLLLTNPGSFMPPAIGSAHGMAAGSGLSSVASSPILGTSVCEKRASPYPLIMPSERLVAFDSAEHKLDQTIRHFVDVNHAITMKDGTRMTSLDLALSRGMRSCAKLLLLHGAVPAQRLNNQTRSELTTVLRRVRHLMKRKSSARSTDEGVPNGSAKVSTFSFPVIESLSQVVTRDRGSSQSEHSLPGTASHDEAPASECGSGWESVHQSGGSGSGPYSLRSSIDADTSLHHSKKLPSEMNESNEVIEESGEGVQDTAGQLTEDELLLNGDAQVTKVDAATETNHDGNHVTYKRCTCLMNGTQSSENSKESREGHAPGCKQRETFAPPHRIMPLKTTRQSNRTNGHTRANKKLTSATSQKSVYSYRNGQPSRNRSNEQRISAIQRNIDAVSGTTNGRRPMRPGNGGILVDSRATNYRQEPASLGSGTSHIWIFRQERKVFEELEEMKLWQIRSGKMNEATAVKRLSEKFVRRMSEMFGIPLPFFSGPYNYKAYEKYLFGVLRKINARRSSLASLNSEPDFGAMAEAHEKDIERELRELAAKKTPTPKTRSDMRYIELQGRRRSKSELGAVVYHDRDALRELLRRQGSRSVGPRWLQRWASDENLYSSQQADDEENLLRLPLLSNPDEGSLFIATKSKLKMDAREAAVHDFLNDLNADPTKPKLRPTKDRTSPSTIPARPINSGKILMNTIRSSTEPGGGETSEWSFVDTSTGGQLPVAEAAFVYPLFMLPPLPSSELVDSEPHIHGPSSHGFKSEAGMETPHHEDLASSKGKKLPPFRHRQCFKTRRRSEKGSRETPIARRMKKRVEKEVSERWSQIKAQESIKLKDHIRQMAQSRTESSMVEDGGRESATDTDLNPESVWSRGGHSSITPEFEILYELGDRSLHE